MIDYEKLLEKYMRAVVADDHIVGLRCAFDAKQDIEDISDEECAALEALAIRIRSQL